MEDTLISTAELKQKLDSGAKDFTLIDTLKPESFEARHVPGAINIVEDVDFVQKVEAQLHPAKDAELIVYCTSETCQRHIRAAQYLRDAGYSNVKRYADGLAGWQNAGYEFAPAESKYLKKKSGAPEWGAAFDC